ncbi:CDP-glycerol glycerophosphotransferase family protein [Natrarchaeobius oligotrophus]|uniref:CDP-glycerol glycerophosphotransferase family protein n=1 Tax=Natrarchaeobius oligotrophus TaxID=3455743 RepID=UPI001404AB7E|nr:CDP-glycerol glycerophosphotransferase family protein [Natrarchaeobius chitinivorans]
MLREDGLLDFIFETTRYVKQYPGSVYFFFNDFKIDVDSGTTLIDLRSSTLGADSFALIQQLEKDESFSRLYLTVTDRSEFEELNNDIIHEFRNLDLEIEVVTAHSKRFCEALAASSLIYLCNRSSLATYRLLDRNSNRTYTSSFHGVIAKAYGTLRPSKTEQKRSDLLSRFRRELDVQSVESDVELYSRATAETFHPDRLQKFGYPRFDRIRELEAGEEEPVLPEEAKRELQDDVFTVLYAPTQRHGYYEPPFLASSETAIEQIREFLSERNIRIYVRTHVNDERRGLYDDVVDGETIRYAGHSFAPMSTELLPFVDVLVTDYSSIYFEFLPFDRPIVFFSQDHERFMRTIGVAFDYDRYFPGPKIQSTEEFLEELESLSGGDDGYRDEREFVRRTFLPPRSKTFLENVLNTRPARN